MKECSCELPAPYGGTVVPFRLRRSARNRYLRVSVKDTGEISLSVPMHISDSGALDFLRSQAKWLVDTIGQARHKCGSGDILEHLRSEPWLSLDGRRAHLMLDESRVRTHWVADPVRCEAIIRCFNDRGVRPEEVTAALVEMARRYVPSRTRELAQRVGVTVGTVRIRNQRSRWGSCTSEGNLSLNWRVILLPPPLHDHIILHELAHLAHMDHSAAFYRQLQQYDPEARQNDHSISKLSPLLMALGR
jgi:predicted metal-dependent hydrolase